MSKDLKSKKEKELRSMLSEKREALRQFRFSAAGARTRNVKEGRNTRRDIARILTELRSKSTT